MIIGFYIFYLLLLYGVLFAAYAGWGRCIFSILRVPPLQHRAVFAYVWVGWVFSLTILHGIHLVHPLTPVVCGIFFLAGFVLFCLRYVGFVNWRNFFSEHRGYLFALLAVTLWVAANAMRPPESYDTGLYYLQAVQWLQEYAIVPGLGNLHSRLAFNMSYFGYIASLNAFPPFSLGLCISNSFLLILVFAECLYGLFQRTVHNEFLYRLDGIVKICLLPLLFTYSVSSSLSSGAPDLGSELIRIVMFYNLIFIVGKLHYSSISTGRCQYLILLAVAAVTVKLSNSMYSLGVVLTCGFLYIYYGKRQQLYRYCGTVIFILLCLGIWAGRGVIVSGCPLYPSTILCSDIEWAMPAEIVEREVTGIKGYRKSWSNKKIEGTKWVRPWIDEQLKHGRMKLLYPWLFSLMATFVGFTWFLKSKRTMRDALFFIPMIPLWAAVVFWFTVSPGIRFVNPFFYLLAIAGFLPVFWAKIDEKIVLIPLLCSLIVVINIPHYFYVIRDFPTVTFDLLAQPVSPKSTEMIMYRTNSGLELFVPRTGDQCWDAPLPATPYPKTDLTLRQGTIQSGFMIP